MDEVTVKFEFRGLRHPQVFKMLAVSTTLSILMMTSGANFRSYLYYSIMLANGMVSTRVLYSTVNGHNNLSVCWQHRRMAGWPTSILLILPFPSRLSALKMERRLVRWTI